MKMKKRGKAYLIELPIYNMDIILSVAQTGAEFRKFALKIWDLKDEELPGDLPDGSSGSTVCRFIGGFEIPYAIRLTFLPSQEPELTTATIAHEVFHTVFRILVSRGLKPCFETEEAYAYLIGHLTREIYKRL